jgi:hypothetical protein
MLHSFCNHRAAPDYLYKTPVDELLSETEHLNSALLSTKRARTNQNTDIFVEPA